MFTGVEPIFICVDRMFTGVEPIFTCVAPMLMGGLARPAAAAIAPVTSPSM
jgi:hypothetical protein